MNKIALLEKVAGYSVVTTVSMVVDNIAWPISVVWLGPIIGGISMTIVAILINVLMIWIYDQLKRDVFGFEQLRKIQGSETKSFWMWLIHKAFKWGKVPAFIALSYYDPFLSVIYMRKGINNYRMVSKDWAYFILAMIIGCFGITIFWSLIVGTIKFGWYAVFH